MEGGVFGVNTGGLRHYLRFGHHCVLARDTPGALDRDWDTDPDWIKVNYRFRRQMGRSQAPALKVRVFAGSEIPCSIGVRPSLWDVHTR